jgi:hypothetical protein
MLIAIAGTSCNISELYDRLAVKYGRVGLTIIFTYR